MRRHPALHGLSRDHHVLLLHARRLRGEDARVDPSEAARRFLPYHGHVGRLHCEEEELAVAPFLPPPLRERLRREHRELEALVARLASEPDVPRELGQRLRDHVRFEEDEAFAELQRTLTAAQWADLAGQASAFRSKARPAGGPDGAEECFL